MSHTDPREVPRLVTDWPQPLPGIWRVHLRYNQLYQIEQAPEGFRLLAFREHPFWIGPEGLSTGCGLPNKAPHFTTSQEAADAAVAHFARNSQAAGRSLPSGSLVS